MKELVELIVRAIVDNPDAVVVQEIEENNVLELKVSVDQCDVGKVIGREGRIANALRTVVKSAAIKQDKKVMLDIITDDDNRNKRMGDNEYNR